MKKKTKAKKLVPMKPKQGWGVVSSNGSLISVRGRYTWPCRADALSNTLPNCGETLRRVKIVEDVK